MLKAKVTISVICILWFINIMHIPAAYSSSNDKQRAADKQRKAFEENKSGKKYPPAFKTDAGDYHNGEDVIVGYDKPMRDWSKPVPEERDIKCPKCSGTGLTKEMVGNVTPKLEVKICRRCSGKGTIGRTKI